MLRWALLLLQGLGGGRVGGGGWERVGRGVREGGRGLGVGGGWGGRGLEGGRGEEGGGWGGGGVREGGIMEVVGRFFFFVSCLPSPLSSYLFITLYLSFFSFFSSYHLPLHLFISSLSLSLYHLLLHPSFIHYPPPLLHYFFFPFFSSFGQRSGSQNAQILNIDMASPVRISA